MVLLACSLDTGFTPGRTVCTEYCIMRILHRSSGFNHHRQADRREWQAHEFSVFLFGSKAVKHKRDHRSGMFTQFEVRESERTALAPLSLRMLLARRLILCRIGLIFWTEFQFTLFVENLLIYIWVEEPFHNFLSTILSSVLIPN